MDIPSDEYAERLAAQAKASVWHPFVDNHLIVKQGIIDKRKVEIVQLVFLLAIYLSSKTLFPGPFCQASNVPPHYGTSFLLCGSCKYGS